MVPYLKNISFCVLNMTTNTMMIKLQRMGSSLIPSVKRVFLDLTNEK